MRVWAYWRSSSRSKAGRVRLVDVNRSRASRTRCAAGYFGRPLPEARAVARPYWPFAARRLDRNATRVGPGFLDIATAKAAGAETDRDLGQKPPPALVSRFRSSYHCAAYSFTNF